MDLCFCFGMFPDVTGSCTGRQMTNCLVFDLGAGSGRAMLAHFDGEHILVSEVHRFTGIEIRLADGLHWDMGRLLAEIEEGIRLASLHCGRIDSIGVDSWGVDYALVDLDGKLESIPYHYRNARSQRGYDRFPISPAELALRTGSQALPVNTVYQLSSAARETPSQLQQSRHALMIADAINYHLTGVARSNVTLARTSGLLSVAGSWDGEICAKVGVNSSLLAPVIEAGAIVGYLRDELAGRIGLAGDIPVISVAGHDTASAICGLPLKGEEAFLVCGSWSIIGRELDRALISDEAMREGFGNEGGVEGRSIFLKSLNGLHLLQKLRAAWSERSGTEISFSAMSHAARAARQQGRGGKIDVSSPVFFDPPDLLGALREACTELRHSHENEIGVLALAIYRGLVEDVAAAMSALEQLTGHEVRLLRICGGGGQDRFLCQMIADRTGKTIAVGPIEASGWGNAVMQLIGLGVVENLSRGRKLVERSTKISNYYPVITAIGI